MRTLLGWLLVVAGSVLSAQGQTVHIPDARLLDAVREALDWHGEDLTADRMRQLTELDASYRQVERLEGLELAVNWRPFSLPA